MNVYQIEIDNAIPFVIMFMYETKGRHKTMANKKSNLRRNNLIAKVFNILFDFDSDPLAASINLLLLTLALAYIFSKLV